MVVKEISWYSKKCRQERKASHLFRSYCLLQFYFNENSWEYTKREILSIVEMSFFRWISFNNICPEGKSRIVLEFLVISREHESTREMSWEIRVEDKFCFNRDIIFNQQKNLIKPTIFSINLWQGNERYSNSFVNVFS